MLKQLEFVLFKRPLLKMVSASEGVTKMTLFFNLIYALMLSSSGYPSDLIFSLASVLCFQSCLTSWKSIWSKDTISTISLQNLVISVANSDSYTHLAFVLHRTRVYTILSSSLVNICLICWFTKGSSSVSLIPLISEYLTIIFLESDFFSTGIAALYKTEGYKYSRIDATPLVSSLITLPFINSCMDWALSRFEVMNVDMFLIN